MRHGCLALWVLIQIQALGGPAPAQTDRLPPALQPGTMLRSPAESQPAGERGAEPPALAPAPEPIPGPAGEGLPPGGADAEVPRGLPINLATALQLAGVNPLDIAAATAQVRQSLALYLQAKVLWVPNINGGVDYFRHDGVQQNLFTGANFRKGRQSFLVGGGPYLSVGLTDAIFSPLAARRVVAARRADLQAARNDVLLDVARAYFSLQEARGRLLGVNAALVRAELLVNLARSLAPSLIPPLEINRAMTERQSLRQAQQLAIRDWQVASARLAETLLLDPASLLEPIEPPFLQVNLVPCAQSLEDLVQVALSYRPEIASRREQVAAANLLLRREKARPLTPTLFVLSPATTTGQLAAGNLTSGANNLMNSNGSRFDIEVAAVWELQNAGFGNLGRIRQRRAEQDLAAVELTRIFYRVRSEVSQADARFRTARIRTVETEEGVRQSVESADKNFIGLRETARPAGELLRLVVRPQEVVQAIDAMNVAYQQYAGAVNEYNTAQFEVYRALGQPAQWVTSRTIDPLPPSNPAAPPPPRTP
jgi:outer membrane protein TolC